MTDRPLVTCRRCGFRNVPGDQFCGSCGAFLEWEGEPTGGAAKAAPPPSDSDSVWPPIPADSIPPAAPTPTPAPAPVRGSWPATPAAPAPSTPAPAAAVDPGLVRCPACGIANPVTRTFCQSCGTTLATASRVAEPSAAEIAAAVSSVPAGPATRPVPPASPRPARTGTAAGASGGIARWVAAMVVLGVAVGVIVVVAGTMLGGGGPAPGASEVPGSGLVASPSADVSGEPAGSGVPGESSAPVEVVTLELTGATASSVVGDRAKFQPEKAIDGDVKTCWQEGAGNEKGQWIEVSFAPSRVDEVVIRSGYQASDSLFRGNLRPKDVLIAVNGGEERAVRLKDTMKAQTIELGGVSGATSLRITIRSTYAAVKTSVKGTPFDDAAISEIRVTGVAGG